MSDTAEPAEGAEAAIDETGAAQVAHDEPPVLEGDDGREPPVKRWVFWPAAGLVLAFVVIALIAPKQTEAVFATVQDAIVRDFGWYYVIVAAGFVLFAIWIGFSRFGDIVLGKDDEQPEF
ncbi:MAG: BCCT family transporter, partial [Curtobacterium sp.]